ncbi:hypothetical protein PFICI_10761 [Pestalotiopsis fici W106-1]|uniref:TauD/TfdA-like domain-containing protein n=1 Tax=Pestalotiopsis fici (strain W106-1 / CGMCC3.15140) TaxID=1229662 RepID=W3WUT3_PESFW|nr:uncharacterized protein PFICI_10761 [Pestalotiopsis fici W106-1]ETS76887.1 hypothetical protein PFICI_10761 [Pestalotiopsis fici W106-1]
MTAHIHPRALQNSFGSHSGSVGDIGLVFDKTDTCSPLENWPDHAVDPDGKLYKNLRVHYLNLDRKHIDEIEKALSRFKELGLDGDEISRENFVLPAIGPWLERCAIELHRGHGVVIIRGLDSTMYSDEDNTMIQLGVGDYLGQKRGVQSSKGAMLSHIVQKKSWTTPPERRHGIHTNVSLPFHTDMGTDILALQVRQCAKVGGETCVSAVRAIYNDLMENHPLVVQALAQAEWPVRRLKLQVIDRLDYSSTKGFIRCPLLTYHRGNLMFSMDPARLGPREGNRAPPLTGEQEAALMILQTVARKHQVKLDHRAGDLVFLNNYTVLHAREAYQDGESTSRHLVRLWLHNPTLGLSIPDGFHLIWDCTFGERSKKIINHSYPVIPMPLYIESKVG